MKEERQGQAEIKKILRNPKLGTFGICIVLDRKLNRDHWMRLSRDGETVWEGKAASLRRKNDGELVEAEQGSECGVQLEEFSDIQVGDLLECFTMKEVVE